MLCELQEAEAGEFRGWCEGINTPAFAWIILACLGGIDLVRGVLHTFLVEHSAVKIAGLNLDHSGQDQLTGAIEETICHRHTFDELFSRFALCYQAVQSPIRTQHRQVKGGLPKFFLQSELRGGR